MRPLAWSQPEQNRRLLEPLLVAAGVLVAVGGGLATALIHPVAGVAALIGALVAVGILVNTQLGLMSFVLVATLVPFAVVPVPLLGNLKPTLLDAALTGLLLAWVFRFLGKPASSLVRTPLDPLVLVFIGLAFTSFTIGVFSVTAEAARFFLKTINSILFFFSVTNCLRQSRQVTSIVRLLVAAGFLASLVALALYVMDAGAANRILNYLAPMGYPSGMVLRYIASTDTLRAIGTSIDPNVLGGTLVLVIPVALGQLFGETPVFERWKMAVIVAAMGLTMALTFSRGSWLGVGAAALFLSGLKYRTLLVLLIIFGAALYFLPVGDVLVERLESGIQLKDQAAAMRLGEYKDALRLISLYPWFGVGFGLAPSIDLYVAASSIYLLMAEQMGLVGLAGFLVIMIALFTYALRSLPKMADPSLRTIQTGALSGVLGALTAGLFDHYFFNFNFPHTVALFWFMVGLVIVATRLGVSATASSVGSSPSSPAGDPALALDWKSARKPF